MSETLPLATVGVNRISMIARLPDGSLFGACGDSAFISQVVEYFRSPDSTGKPKPDGQEGFRGMLVVPGAEFPFEMDTDLVPRQMRVPYASIGENSAECIAAGALAMGATAEQAVKIAIENCVWIGGDVQVETL